MLKSITVKRKKRGRPATGQTPFVGVRLSTTLTDQVDDWAAKNNGGLSRSEAIRRLVEIGLSAPVRSPWKTSAAREVSAASAEKHAHDHMDKALKGETATVREARKKQLTSMPGGFNRR